MNPELQRNLWLEASPQRLAWTGVTLAILFGSCLAFGEAAGGYAKAFLIMGSGVFVVAGVIWGSMAAGRSIGNEVAQRTWDFQRLSALTPWEMTFGKLAGSTSLAWLAAGAGLLAAAAAAVAEGDGDTVLYDLALAVGAAVILQAGSMALGLVGIRRARADGRTAPMRVGCGGVIGGLILLGVVQRTLSRGLPVGGPFAGLGGERSWWGAPVHEAFWALSALVFAAWAVTAAWRLMRLELQMQNRPWAWPGFVLFAGLYAAGFAEDGGVGARFAAAGLAFGACAYLAAFAEPADRVRVRMFVAAVRQGRTDEALLKLPTPVVPLLLTLAAALGVLLQAASMRLYGVAAPGLIALAVAAFVVRDVGVVAFFRFGPRTRRGDFGAVVGLFLLYFVGGLVGRSLGGEAGAAMFIPTLHYSGLGAVAGAAEAGLVWWAAWTRMRAPEPVEAG